MDAAEIASALAEHDGLIRMLVYRRLKPGEDGDDALQDARIAAMEACRSWRPGRGSKLSSWIGNAVTWSVRARREYWMCDKRRGGTVSLDDERRDWEPAIEHDWPDLDRGDLWLRVERAIEPRYAAMVIRHFRDGETCAAIARDVGLTRERVRQIVQASVSWLREAWKLSEHGSA